MTRVSRLRIRYREKTPVLPGRDASVCTLYLYTHRLPLAAYVQQPRVATDFAVLNHLAVDVAFDVDLDRLEAVRALDGTFHGAFLRLLGFNALFDPTGLLNFGSRREG